MHRYVCRLGPVNLYAYGLMLALAFAAGTWIAVARARRRGVPAEAVYDLVLWILVSSLLGARLFFVALNFGYYLERPLDILKLWEGGLVLYGGIVAGFAAAVYFLKLRRLAVWKIADIIAPGLAVGVGIGRIGCFLNGCCYGKLSTRWGVRFPAVDAPPAYEEQLRSGLIQPGSPWSLPVLPTQLYEALACFVIAGVLLLLERGRKRFDGYFFWLFIVLYSVERFFMEGLRQYEQDFYVGGLTVGQLMSIGLFITAMAVIAFNSRAHGTSS